MPKSRRVRAIAVGALLAVLVAVMSVDYTVERGDTLGEIARQHNVSLSDLVEANDISNPNLIHPGQVLVIPGKNGQPGKVHVVEQGDTLGEIASKYGSSVSALAKNNGISNPNLIRIGQKIQIPKGSGGGSSGGGSSGGSNGRSGNYHVVKPGEKLSSIAAQYSGVSADQIAKANGILNGTIYSGTRLFLDGPSYTAKGSEGGSEYRVKNGDRLGDIASAHGTSISSLASANNISNPNFIRVGQTLTIPSGTRWVCPVDNASFFNDWGFPRAGGIRFHEGNDLYTTHGAPVYAPVSGTVRVTTGSIGGKQFTLDGDDGVEYLGSHLSAFGKTGRVNGGDIVGHVGTSGNAVGSSPHLHFGMYLSGGIAVNPYPTLIEHGCK